MATDFPVVPTGPVHTWSEDYRRDCLAAFLADRSADQLAAWRAKNRRSPLLADMEQRISHEQQQRRIARALLLDRSHQDIRAWLDTLPEPLRRRWAARLNSARTAITTETTTEEYPS